MFNSPHATREPINTYEQAVWRLAQFCVTEAPGLHSAVLIVSDIYWIAENKVLSDVKAALADIGGTFPAKLPVLAGYLRPKSKVRL